MLEAMRKALVDSYVGAIALGWLFGEGLLHFASIFAAPVSAWLMRRTYAGLGVIGRTTTSASFSFQDSIPELISSTVILLLGYLLLRWLYFKPSMGRKDEVIAD